MKIAGYFTLAISIYVVSILWQFHSHFVHLATNSILFASFLGFVFYKENLIRFFSRKPLEL